MNKFQRNIYRTVFENEIPIISCSEIATSGGVGVAEYILALDKPLGGIVVIDFDPQGVPDKLEILHNGVKKATSGMTVSNSGPFDNIYGDPIIPDVTQANIIDQFIGTSKGAVPTRDVIFLSETGITDIVRTKQQLIWWVYTPTDYNVSTNVIIRVTGIIGTAWNLQRLCTDQIPKDIIPPDTDPNNYTYYEAEYYDCVSETCGTEANPLWVFTLNTGLTKNMYYYYSDNVTGKSFKILGDPKTYTEYVVLGEPAALKTTFVNAYVTCTCLPPD